MSTQIIKGILFNRDDSGNWYYHGRRYSIDLVPMGDPDSGTWYASAWDDSGLVAEQPGTDMVDALDALLIQIRGA